MRRGVVSGAPPRPVPHAQPQGLREERARRGGVAVVCTFDLDAEAHLLAQDPTNLARVSLLSSARYGVRRGLQRVLRVLAQEDVRATFFVPGWVIHNEPDACRQIAAEGHEVAHHGYTHTSPLSCSLEEERDELRRGIDAIAALTGRPPAGYRAPFRDVSPHTFDLLVEFGFLYSSNLQDDDRPYLHPQGSRGGRLVEIPVNPLADDASYFLYRPPAHRLLLPADHALSVWQAELAALAREPGSCLVLTLHPDLIGRASRCETLRAFIRFAREQEHVRFLTARELAEACARGEW